MQVVIGLLTPVRHTTSVAPKSAKAEFYSAEQSITGIRVAAVKGVTTAMPVRIPAAAVIGNYVTTEGVVGKVKQAVLAVASEVQ